MRESRIVGEILAMQAAQTTMSSSHIRAFISLVAAQANQA